MKKSARAWHGIEIGAEKGVNDRDIRVRCELIQCFLREDSRDDSLHPALEVAGDVADWLAFAKFRPGMVEKSR